MNILFAGTPQFAALALDALRHEHHIAAVLTQPDRPSGRGMQLTASPVKQLALAHGMPVLQPVTLKTAGAQQEIASLSADVMIVAAYGLILPQAVLSMPRYGCLNIHASLLPRWRGAAPIQRAIQAGDSETGITIMQMDAGLDTGDMLLKQTCAIVPNDTAATLHDKLATLGASSILQALRLLATGQLQPVKQNNNEACYAAKLLKNEAAIDWREDAQTIERKVRAFIPFPVCHSNLRGSPIKIWQASLSEGEGAPGMVLAADKQGILVACGKRALRLELLQRPGSKTQTAAQLLQAMPVATGEQFT
jgi:methionyl-tRNA formyltransferase